MHLLSLADHIVVLSAHGTVADQGSLKALTARGLDLVSLAKQATVEDKDETKKDNTPSRAAVEVTAIEAANDAETTLTTPKEIDEDWAVWKFYARTIGAWPVAYFIFIQFTYSFFVTFSRKSCSLILQNQTAR